MNNPVLFYSELCSDTAPFIAELERLNIVYKAVNVFESMANFKQFLQLRDTNEAFDNVKALGNIGVPAFVINDQQIILAIDELKQLRK